MSTWPNIDFEPRTLNSLSLSCSLLFESVQNILAVMAIRRTGSPTKSSPRRRRPLNGGTATSSPSPLRRVDSWHTDDEGDPAEAGDRTRTTRAAALSSKDRIPSPTLRSTRRNAHTRPSEDSPPLALRGLKLSRTSGHARRSA